jgi:hypothetical protein
MKKLIITLLFVLTLAISVSANFPVDPNMGEFLITRTGANSAVVNWQTSYPVTGGVLQYSKKHPVARGLDPFTLRIALETSEVSLQHQMVVEDIDISTEWRFRISYQFAENSKFDSCYIHPFRNGETLEVITKSPVNPISDSQ